MPTLNFKINQFFFLSVDKRSRRAPEGGCLLFTAENTEATFITKLSAGNHRRGPRWRGRRLGGAFSSEVRPGTRGTEGRTDLIKAMAVSIDLILAQGLNTQRQEGESLSPWSLLSVACGQWVN